MRKNPMPWIALVALVVTAPLGAQEAASLDDVIARNVETRGGLEALKTVETARMTGTMTVPGGGEVPFTIEYRRPNKMRMEATMQGMTMVQAVDGDSGWAIMPFMGKTDPEPMAEDQLKQMKSQSDMIEGDLVDWADKGHQVELLGKEEIEGTEAYKLKVVRSNGDVVYSYLDTEYCLEFKRETKTEVMGQEMNVSVAIGDYKEVGGVVLAHSIEATAEGVPQGQVITVEQVELNVDVGDDRFAMPEVEEKPAAEGGESGGE